MMSDLIEEQSKEALFEFRRCIDIAELIGARYGLRGVRVGEASNPSPPFDAPPNPALCPDDVLARLEADLTRIDSSDDEPLVRGATGRIVSRRVGLMESASRSVCPVVDMAAEDSHGVELLPCRFSRRVVLLTRRHPTICSGQVTRNVGAWQQIAALAGADTDAMPWPFWLKAISCSRRTLLLRVVFLYIR